MPLHPACAVVLSLFAATGAWGEEGDQAPAEVAPEVQFNDKFLEMPGVPRVDISRFNKGNVALPGEYRAELYVNQAWLGRAAVTLRQAGGDRGNVQPCFDRAMLERIGVDLARLTAQAQARLAGGDTACAPLPEIVQDATAVFDNGEQRLDVTVPQIAMSRHARGYVDPKYWDDGVTAARLLYNANLYRSDSTGSSGTSVTQGYLGLNAGINVGAWRFRHLGNLTQSGATGTTYQSVQTSLQRAIVPIRSQLLLGDAFTDGTMFDSVGFRGVQLASDDRMYPESQRGYAPVVHGIASSNARVQVRQNGNIIYETTVAAGAFEINDLYPTGYGGDLEVVVTEADGSAHISRVPYAAAVNALRPGFTRYSIVAGQYRSTAVHSTPMMFQATVQHGFSNTLTGYGGVLLAQDYAAAVADTALNTDLGAFGADVTQAVTRFQNQPGRSGQSVRLTYMKLLEPTHTSLSLAAYRYSTSGYLTLADAVALRDLDRRGMGALASGIQRARLQLMVNQSLPAGYGSFYATGSAQNYWNRGGTDTQFQVGYNNSYRRVNFGVSAARQRDVSTGRWDNRVMVSAGIPLGKGQHAPYSMTTLQRDSSGAVGVQQSVTGALGADNAVTYGLSAGYSGGGKAADAASLAGNVSYVSPVATLTANASGSRNYSQVGAGISGGIVAYAGGVAFAPSLGDTMAIVEARDAAGARVANGSGLRVDPWGRAVVSTLTPFSSNQIELDPKGLPMHVELKSTLQHVAPTSGAVVRVRFETDNPGRAALLRVRSPQGEPIPFGAEVLNAAGHSTGTVAQGGRVIVRGLQADGGQLLARWGGGAGESCVLDYSFAGAGKASASLLVLDTECK